MVVAQVMALALVAQSESSGPAHLAPSHQQIQETSNA
jgi:hypothetical protein